MIRPIENEIFEAKNQPGGWVYRIAGEFSEHDDIPPEAIIGAWQVDENGCIVGEFHPNPRYDPNLFPAHL